MYYVGIDIGTSSICGVAYNPLTKSSITIVKDNNTGILSEKPWEKMQDADAIFHVVEEILLEFRQKCADIKGIGFSGQMHGMLYVDNRGEAVSPLYTWQDVRGNLIYKEGRSYAEFLNHTTGYPMATGYGLVTHFYNRHNDLVPPATHKLCTIMDYVVMKLCGQDIPFIDYSNAAGFGLFDKELLSFDTSVCSAVQIGKSILPEVVPSGTLVGFCENIPVYVAIGDNQAAFLGSVKDIGHSIHITVGTSSQISVFTDRYVEVEGLDVRPFPGGGYILVGASLCGGASFSMLKDFFADTLKLFMGVEKGNDELYRRMISIPYQTGIDDNLVVETLFSGTRSEPEKRGKIDHISLANFTPENLIRGFVKGISQGLYDYFRLIPDSIKQNKTILVGSGNGIKKNPLLCKALEECFDRPLHLSDIQEEAAFGACVCAMVGGKQLQSFVEQ